MAVEGDPDYPATANAAECWETARTIAVNLLGLSNACLIYAPQTGGEDFAFYLQHVPGCFAGLGMANADIGATHFVHTPFFKVDEDALPIGVAMHVGFALQSLAELGGTMSE